MKPLVKPEHERILDLEREVKELRAEIARLWEAHTNLNRRAAPAILMHTKFGGSR